MPLRFLKTGLNRYFARQVGREDRPTFFDIQATCPALNRLTEHFPVIRHEFDRACAQANKLPRYHQIDPGERGISASTPGDWKVFMLYLLGHRPPEASRLCPETSQLLDGLPGLVQAFFSILDQGKSIPPHQGPYLGYLRYHLGLHIPTQDPPHLVVNGQTYRWREGEAILFDDSWRHEVINHSAQRRAVLIVDVLRPMPPWPHRVNRFCTQVIARHTYGRQVSKQLRQYAVTERPPIE
jgi:aspartate beta-hydroxylase